MKKTDPAQLDSIIDGALARYGNTQPLDGIAQRVLNRIAAADQGHRTSRILAWALCCPVLITLVPMAISVWTPAVMKPAHIDFATLPHVPPPPNAFVIIRRPERQSRLRIALRSPFISLEERGLLALAQSHPAEAREFLAVMQKRNEEPVEIDDIQVSLLEIPEIQLKEK